jgi:hypothetical protein
MGIFGSSLVKKMRLKRRFYVKAAALGSEGAQRTITVGGSIDHVWTQVQQPYIKSGGDWQKAENVYKKFNGSWELVHSGEKIHTTVRFPSIPLSNPGGVGEGADFHYIDVDLLEYMVNPESYGAPRSFRTFPASVLNSTPLEITIHVDPGVKILRINITKFHASTRIVLRNYGMICGRGGGGGARIAPHNVGSESGLQSFDQLDGVNGEAAIATDHDISIENYGEMYGGGGGGHAGMPYFIMDLSGQLFYDRGQYFLKGGSRNFHGASLSLPGYWKSCSSTLVSGSNGIFHDSFTRGWYSDGRPTIHGASYMLPAQGFWYTQLVAAHRYRGYYGWGAPRTYQYWYTDWIVQTVWKETSPAKMVRPETPAVEAGNFDIPVLEQAVFWNVLHGGGGGGGAPYGPKPLLRVQNDNSQRGVSGLKGLGIRWGQMLSRIIWDHNFNAYDKDHISQFDFTSFTATRTDAVGAFPVDLNVSSVDKYFGDGSGDDGKATAVISNKGKLTGVLKDRAALGHQAPPPSLPSANLPFGFTNFYYGPPHDQSGVYRKLGDDPHWSTVSLYIRSPRGYTSYPVYQTCIDESPYTHLVQGGNHDYYTYKWPRMSRYPFGASSIRLIDWGNDDPSLEGLYERMSIPTPHTSEAEKESLNFGTQDFTVECWFRVNDWRTIGQWVVPNTRSYRNEYWSGLISKMAAPNTSPFGIGYSPGGSVLTSYEGWCLGFNNYGQLQWQVDNAFGDMDGPLLTGDGYVKKGRWHHVAVSRYGGEIFMFLDGEVVASAVDTRNYDHSVWDKTSGSGSGAYGWSELVIGDYYTNVRGYNFNGWLEDIRITKGMSRYPVNTFWDGRRYLEVAGETKSQMKNLGIPSIEDVLDVGGVTKPALGSEEPSIDPWTVEISTPDLFAGSAYSNLGSHNLLFDVRPMWQGEGNQFHTNDGSSAGYGPEKGPSGDGGSGGHVSFRDWWGEDNLYRWWRGGLWKQFLGKHSPYNYNDFPACRKVAKDSWNKGVKAWLDSWKTDGGKGGEMGEAGESFTVEEATITRFGQEIVLPSITINGGSPGEIVQTNKNSVSAIVVKGTMKGQGV